jgi:N-carbamoyl-L-amino-acid hydrolase
VRNGGKYDGRLGIFVPMACVRELHRAGKRLPFGIEVVAFAEEEGQRYKATFLGSGALIGHFNPAWLDQKDADGITMREAMQHAGLCIDDIAKLQRDPAQYLGFIEVHIEQGPVLNELDLPLGVVTSINGSVRYLCEMIGTASHAGTTPMDRAATPPWPWPSWRCTWSSAPRKDGDSVGTIGLLNVPNGSINVVPGRCQFSLDLRAPTDAQRDALVTDVLANWPASPSGAACATRWKNPCAPPPRPAPRPWQHRWERAVDALGLPVFRMPSGAGHDAMKLHEIMPQAMLFVRGENSGISHNPLESTTNTTCNWPWTPSPRCCTSLPRNPTMTPPASYDALDAWIDQHFDEEVRFLQALVRVPTDTPPGNNAPHAERTAELLKDFGFDAEKHAVPAAEVQAYGMESITNLIVRRPYGDRRARPLP